MNYNINWNCIGVFLEKKVLFTSVDKISEFEGDMLLQNSIVAVHISDNDIGGSDLEKFYKKILAFSPLSIVVSGKNSDENFKLLLEIQSNKSSGLHTMTGLSEGEEWLDDFFLATWPAEERHDSWSLYSLIAVGKNQMLNVVKEYIAQKNISP